MGTAENKLMRRRLRNAFLSTVISTSLVLLNARSVSDYFKENLQVSVLMKTEVSDEETVAFQTQLDSLPFIRSTRIVSKQQGSEELAGMLGEDFLRVFESSPIPASIDVNLRAD